MSVLSVTQKFQKITIPANTNAHTLIFSALATEKRKSFDILIKWTSGTSFQISNVAVDADSGTMSTTNDKVIFFGSKQTILHLKGGAGSETFTVNIC